METQSVVRELRYKVDVNTLHKEEDGSNLGMNEIGRVCIRTASPLLFDSYRRSRTTGSFVMVDANTNETVGAGMIL